MEKRIIYLILLIACPIILFGQQNTIKRSDHFPQDEQKASFGHGICTTMEMDALLRSKNPSMGSLEDFERKFQRDISDFKARLRSGVAIR